MTGRRYLALGVLLAVCAVLCLVLIAAGIAR